MGEESQIITKLKGHIEHIISCYEGALFEKSELEKKLSEAQNDLEKYKTRVKELEDKLEKRQLTTAFEASSQDIKEARQRIAKIVREIDKCISLLNN